MISKQDQQPLRIIQPEFIKNIALLETALFSTLIIFAMVMTGGVILMLLLTILHLNAFLPGWLPFFAILVAATLLIPPWVYKMVQKNSADSYYKFYGDHLTFQQYQLLFFKKRGRLKYADIQDIIERTDLLRSRYDIGNVWFLAPGTGIAANQAFPGLKISHIRLSDDLTDFFETIMTGMPETTDLPAAAPPRDNTVEPQPKDTDDFSPAPDKT